MSRARRGNQARGRTGGKVGPLIDIIVGSPRWRTKPRAGARLRKAIVTAAKAVSTPHIELAIVLTDDSAIRALNREWRKLDAPTNVLSFPATTPHRTHGAAGRRVARTSRRRHLGDIIIAYQTTAREAAAEGKSFDHHLVHLAVHGFLHLLGYDHPNARAADRMERLEIDILARLDVPDPYAARDRAS